ncbi:uncharacterized protein BJ212DRAFT_663668 [Suillus subaureus]|uniref:Secreted protein n=1 Tax=Suillus subaureus TaxID=48587 RepID=A0A9P7J8E7_9AGAM|nr:uncharacterized protein BJ212DRAFT_663668 [Suillus subaureus]KAG1808187.1 hypothetical protein BJ212DRAFT_663668 [Suillus subaureus]
MVSAGLFQCLGLICNLVLFAPTSARRHLLTRSSSSRQPDKCDRYTAPYPFHLSFEEGRSPQVFVSFPSRILKLVCAAVASYQNQPTLCLRLSAFDQKCMPSLAHLSYRLSCIRAANFRTLTRTSQANTATDDSLVPTWWM